MQLQNKIEQTAKEYMLLKALYEEKQKTIPTKEETAKSALGKTKEQIYTEMFDKVGIAGLIGNDANQMKQQLYHYVKLAEDIVEIPQEIKDLVADVKPTFIFTTTGEVANKEALEERKKEFVNYYLEVEKQMSKLNREQQD